MAIGSAAQVNPKTQGLYKYLGFDDKNNNGVIEKDKDENYKEEADINKDGKLVKAEILYYLHYVVETAPEKTKQENPITEEDQAVLASLFKEALVAARTIESSWGKASALRGIALEMAKAGLGKEEISKVFKEALVAARTIEDSNWKVLALRKIAKEMTKAGLFKEALGVARTIEDSDWKAFALADIASEMAKAGLGKEEISKVFKEALGAARTIEDSNEKASALADIASEMAKAGLGKEEINKLFKEAEVERPE